VHISFLRTITFGRLHRNVPWLARHIVDCLRSSCAGRFQAMMQVELVNEGPVTILLDSRKAL
jgi:D-Tyr-tRNAtyr deacylase